MLQLLEPMTGGVHFAPPSFTLSPRPISGLFWPNLQAQNKAHEPTPPELHGPNSSRVVRCSGENLQPFLFRAPPPTSHGLPLPMLPPELGPSHQSSPIPREEQTWGCKISLAFLPTVQPRNERNPGKMIPPSPSKGVNKQVSPPRLTEVHLSKGLLETSGSRHNQSFRMFIFGSKNSTCRTLSKKIVINV